MLRIGDASFFLLNGQNHLNMTKVICQQFLNFAIILRDYIKQKLVIHLLK